MKPSEGYYVFWGMRYRPFVHVMLVTLLLGSSVTYAAVRQESLEALGLIAGPGTAAPNFRLPDLKGHMVNLGDHRDKVVMLYFWTTW